MNLNDVDKVVSAITNDEKYEHLVHDVCHMPHVTTLKEFYEIYELEERAIDEKYNLATSVPTIELFEELFKKFDEYPINLQKLKKPLMRERLNSNMSRSSPTLNDSTVYHTTSKENSMSLSNLNKFDDVPTTSKTLSNFVKFQKQLQQLDSEINQNDLEREYVNKLKQLKTFSLQLEKFMPTEKVAKPALTTDEEVILEDLANGMNNLNFIRNYTNIFHQQSAISYNSTPKMDSLVDILTNCLLALNSFDIN